MIPIKFGPTFALVQGLVDVRTRALASSIMLFLLNIVGPGLGLQLVGVFSDILATSFGRDSLRLALIAPACVNLWCAYHYLLAGNALTSSMKTSNVG